MTLDEAIRHAEEVAERLENSHKRDWMCEDDERCAKEHRQLAAWLKELRVFKSRKGQWLRMTRDEALKQLKDNRVLCINSETEPFAIAYDTAIKELEKEPLTDKEQRIFLAAMGREEKICREVDDKYPDKEPYEDSLVSVCRSIERKVKKALWE